MKEHQHCELCGRTLAAGFTGHVCSICRVEIEDLRANAAGQQSAIPDTPRADANPTEPRTRLTREDPAQNPMPNRIARSSAKAVSQKNGGLTAMLVWFIVTICTGVSIILVLPVVRNGEEGEVIEIPVSNPAPPVHQSGYDYIGSVATARGNVLSSDALIWGTYGDAAAFTKSYVARDDQGLSLSMMLALRVPPGTRLHILDVVAYPIGNYDYFLYNVRYENPSPTESMMTLWTNAVYLDLPHQPAFNN